MSHPIFSCFWFKDQAKEAASYYCGIFKDSKILTSNDMLVTFELNGTRFMGLNGNTYDTFTQASSHVVSCDTQEEIDHYWNSLTASGGEESMCGWLKDKYGVSWQIVPKNIEQLIGNPVNGQRAIEAMLKMRKLVISDLENA